MTVFTCLLVGIQQLGLALDIRSFVPVTSVITLWRALSGDDMRQCGLPETRYPLGPLKLQNGEITSHQAIDLFKFKKARLIEAHCSTGAGRISPTHSPKPTRAPGSPHAPDMLTTSPSSKNFRLSPPSITYIKGTATKCVGSRASISTTQGLIVVPKFLLLKGPSGTYSQAWMSRADQSFINTIPNKCSGAS
ncbi:hypothetical protein KC357_g134 [Hortaea werneckii]|nr:hypothetical protein KC357_g134 [Hortaea werneckii]